jgi:23S rRNA (cytidine2498-2'-O)-methyltransferase
MSFKRHSFPWLLPDASVGAWALLDEHTLLASARCSSPFPGGVIEFEEDKNGPPSRAYLKLWEALVRCRVWPHAGERCLDAGASPGGWTWALACLGADVIAVDRALLAEQVACMPGVRFMQHNAFSLQPEDIGPIDWLFCDVICYPDRLYEWLEKWLAAGLCGNFVCTIKTQSADTRQNFGDTLRRFASLGGQIVHLYHNKHELTWLKVRQRPDE